MSFRFNKVSYLTDRIDFIGTQKARIERKKRSPSAVPFIAAGRQGGTLALTSSNLCLNIYRMRFDR
jgi:hypothetical protein